jgi:hypothetical protein
MYAVIVDGGPLSHRSEIAWLNVPPFADFSLAAVPAKRGRLFVSEGKGLPRNAGAIMRMSMGEAVGAVIE